MADVSAFSTYFSCSPLVTSRPPALHPAAVPACGLAHSVTGCIAPVRRSTCVGCYLQAGKEHDRLHEEKVGKARKGSATDSPQAVGSADVTQKAEAFLASFMTDKGAEQQL